MLISKLQQETFNKVTVFIDPQKSLKKINQALQRAKNRQCGEDDCHPVSELKHEYESDTFIIWWCLAILVKDEKFGKNQDKTHNMIRTGLV